MNTVKIMILSSIIFCLYSCISITKFDEFLDFRLKHDSLTYSILRTEGKSFLGTNGFVYRAERNNKFSLFIKVDSSFYSNKGKIRFLISDSTVEFYFKSDSENSKEEKINLETNLFYKNIYKKAIFYDSIMKLASCYYYSYPRIGYNLLYYQDGSNSNTKNLKIEGNWYYDTEKFNSYEKKYLLKSFHKYFKKGS